MSGSERIKRQEACKLLSIHPNSRALLLRWERDGRLTRFYQKAPGKRGHVEYLRSDVERLIEERSEWREERSAVKIKPAKKGKGGGKTPPNGRQTTFVPDFLAEGREKNIAAWEAFERETMTEAQACKTLRLDALEFLELLDAGIIRARRMRGEERYERDDVLAQLDRMAGAARK